LCNTLGYVIRRFVAHHSTVTFDFDDCERFLAFGNSCHNFLEDVPMLMVLVILRPSHLSADLSYPIMPLKMLKMSHAKNAKDAPC
jgi:hypothetical protein